MKIEPQVIDFYFSMPNSIADRIVYTKDESGNWSHQHVCAWNGYSVVKLSKNFLISFFCVINGMSSSKAANRHFHYNFTLQKYRTQTPPRGNWVPSKNSKIFRSESSKSLENVATFFFNFIPRHPTNPVHHFPLLQDMQVTLCYSEFNFSKTSKFSKFPDPL